MKKNFYRIIVILFLTIILIVVGKYFQFEIKWYYYLIIIFISNILGSFFFVYFSGVNISNLEYLDNPDISQKFRFEYQLGFSEMKSVKGVFQNEFNLEEADLRNIIYQQTKRKEITELEFTDEKQMSYFYKNQKFQILFKN